MRIVLPYRAWDCPSYRCNGPCGNMAEFAGPVPGASAVFAPLGCIDIQFWIAVCAQIDQFQEPKRRKGGPLSSFGDAKMGDLRHIFEKRGEFYR